MAKSKTSKNGTPATKSRFANRDMFYQRAKRRYRELDIPGFGEIRIRDVSAFEIQRIQSHHNEEDVLQLITYLAVLCIVDENGEQIFTNDDVKMFEELDYQTSTPLYAAINEHCGLAKASDLQSAVGN